jgi:hypothetical protein
MKLFNSGVKPSDIFVLGASVKGERSNIRKIENMLVEKNVPCYVPMMENEHIDDRISNGKVVFSTFHSVKGRQRRYVFVTGFDNSYFKYNARTLDSKKCPNTMYVATTRALEGLYLLEGDNNQYDRPLDFLNMSHVEMKQQPYLQFRGQHQNIFIENKDTESVVPYRTTPTELTRFIPDNILEDIYVVLERVFTSEIVDNMGEIDMPSVIETRSGFFEEVSDINGIAIPCIYYDYLTDVWCGNCSQTCQTDSCLFDIINMHIENIVDKQQWHLKKIVDNLPNKLESINDYLYLANVSQAMQDSLYFKLMQIERDEYTWLNENLVELCKERMKRVMGKDCKEKSPKIEEYIILSSADEQHTKIDEVLGEHFDGRKFRLTARVDLITDATVWEIKCTSKLTVEHMLQLVIYAWICNNLCSKHLMEKQFKLFNIRTGELMTLNASNEDLTYIMVSILRAKYSETIQKTDEEFIEECRNYVSK